MVSTQTKPPAAESKDVKVHNAIELSTKNPLPITFGGDALTTIYGYQYIPFFAPNDNLFRSLLELRLLSPTQDGCITDKTFYSIGSGLQVKDEKVFPSEFDKKINGKRQTIDDILKGVFDALYQDGNAFIEIARTTVGDEKYVHVYLHPNMDCRFEANDGDDPTHVLRSKNFRKDEMYHWDKKSKPVKIPLWSDDPMQKTSVWTGRGNVERTMIHLKREVAGVDHYGLPSNFSGFMNAVLEYRSARFNGDNFENNFFASGLLVIQGNLSKQEANGLVKDLKKEHTGEGQNLRIIPLSSEGGITDSKFIPFNQTHDGHFIEFDKHQENKIIGANNWSRALRDMQETGSLGKGGQYLANLFKMKFQTVIMPMQQMVLNNFVFPLMQIIDEYKGTKFYDKEWTIDPVVPIGLEDFLDINSLLTVDEGRETLKKKPLGSEKGKMLISEVKGKSSEKPKPTAE